MLSQQLMAERILLVLDNLETLKRSADQLFSFLDRLAVGTKHITPAVSRPNVHALDSPGSNRRSPSATRNRCSNPASLTQASLNASPYRQTQGMPYSAWTAAGGRGDAAHR